MSESRQVTITVTPELEQRVREAMGPRGSNDDEHDLLAELAEDLGIDTASAWEDDE